MTNNNNRDKLDNYICRILEQPLSKMLNNYIDEMLSFGARQREEEIDHLMYVWRLHTTERNADTHRFVIGCFKSGKEYFLSYLKRKIYQARHIAKKERDENKSNEYYWTTRYEEVEEIIANF
jgi:transcription initiation factor IIE alpha subunit